MTGVPVSMLSRMEPQVRAIAKLVDAPRGAHRRGDRDHHDGDGNAEENLDFTSDDESEDDEKGEEKGEDDTDDDEDAPKSLSDMAEEPELANA